MTGRVQIGDRSWPNQWVEDGKIIRLIMCPVCEDTGRRLVDNQPCLCTRSWTRSPDGDRS